MSKTKKIEVENKIISTLHQKNGLKKLNDRTYIEEKRK